MQRMVSSGGDASLHWAPLIEVLLYRLPAVVPSDHPTLKLLRESVDEADKADGKSEAVTRERLANMLEFFELANQWAESSQKVSTGILVKAARMGDKLFKLLGLAG